MTHRSARIGMVVLGWWLTAAPVQATDYIDVSLEGESANTVIVDGASYDGYSWDLFGGDAAYPTQYVRATISTPAGTNFHEVLTICGGYTGGNRCTPANDPTVTTNQAQANIYRASHTFVADSTHYLGAFIRFDRVGSRNVWATLDSFDKLLEFGCAGCNTRWGIGSGRHGNYTDQNGLPDAATFTFDLWCADSAFDACEVPANNDWDHKAPNVSPYSTSSPYLCAYGQWYAVVMAVTFSTTTSGNVRLWINGTKIMDYNRITMATGGYSDLVALHGTIAQPAYDAPDHYRRMDRILWSDSLTAITNAGLMQDPTGSPAAPIALFLASRKDHQ